MEDKQPKKIKSTEKPIEYFCPSLAICVSSIIVATSFYYAWMNPDQHREGSDDLRCYVSDSGNGWEFYTGAKDPVTIQSAIEDGTKIRDHSM